MCQSVQSLVVPMLGSACSSGKVDPATDYMVGAKYKEQLKVSSRGCSWWSHDFQAQPVCSAASWEAEAVLLGGKGIAASIDAGQDQHPGLK